MKFSFACLYKGIGIKYYVILEASILLKIVDIIWKIFL